MKLDTKIVAILTLGCLESVAMLTGSDGMFLLPIVAIIAGLAGYAVSPNVVAFQERRMNKHGK